MDFIFGLIKVVAGTFVLFTLARMALAAIGTRSKWLWVAMVGAHAASNMLIHRVVGSTINLPFFTAVFLGITLSGLTPKESERVDPWIKRAIIAVARMSPSARR
jgi:hypothetical protein